MKTAACGSRRNNRAGRTIRSALEASILSSLQSADIISGEGEYG
jgi:hypothetical protein